jgi:hypothetical protein
VKREDDTAHLRLEASQPHGVVFLPGRRQRWELGVPTELPLRYGLEGVLVRSRFDLARSRFEGGHVNGVFMITQLTLPAVDAPVTLRLNGAFNMLRVNVPEGTPVQVKGTGFPFNLIKRRVVGEPGRAGYEIQLDGVFSAVAVDTGLPRHREAPPAEAPPGEPPKPEAEPTAKELR